MRKKRKDFHAGQIIYKNWAHDKDVPQYDVLLVLREDIQTKTVTVIELTDERVISSKRDYSRDFCKKYLVYEEPNV